MIRLTSLLLGLALACLSGCAYPQHRTSMAPVSRSVNTSGSPPYVYEFTLVSANIEPRQRSGHDWDDNAGLPDAFLRVYRAGTLIWESRPVNDELNPEFNQRPPTNLRLPSNVTIRLELWDDDTASEDPIGVWQGLGLPPTALPGANARILLEGRSWLTIRIREARAFRGVGLRQYEQHPDYLEILDVEPASPAGRAELLPGDHITGIDGRLIADMTPGEASSQISLAGARPARLAIERNGIAEIIELDGGYTWPSL